MRSFRLIILLWKQSLMREMAYPKNFLFLIVVQIGWFAIQILTIEIIFSHTRSLVGWSQYDALALISIFSMVVGGLRFFFEMSFTQFCADVHDGTFDFYCTRPVDSRLFLSFRRLTLEHIGVIVFNIGLLAILIARGMIHVTFSSVFGFIVLLMLGFIIGYCLWFMLTLLIFWSPTIEQFNYLYTSTLTAVRFPLDIYGPTVRRILLTVLPIGFLTVVPAEFLLGIGTLRGIASSVAIAAMVVGASQWWWRFAARHYSSASS